MAKKPLQVPALDLFRGFEAAARHLSFTRAAEELFVTQSAVSRQIQSLEQQLDVALFVRRNRGLSLTAEGEQLLRGVEEALRTLHDAVESIAPDSRQNLVTVTSSIAFCSLWLIPRLADFRKLHPEVDVHISADNRVVDLDRERIDVGIRYCPVAKAPPGSVRLFGEEILPVCSPALLKDRSRPLKSVADLKHQVLLHFDDSDRSVPWLAWGVWLESAGLPDLRPAGSLRFSHYDQVVNAAIGGQGVALGRRPLVRQFIESGALVVPFALGSVTDRAYFIVRTAATAARSEVNDFVDWLIAQSVALAAALEQDKPVGKRALAKGR